MAQLYDSFGSLYMKSGEFDLAVRYFQQALTAISSDFNDLEFAKNPEPAQINEKVSALKILKNKADALTKQFGQRKDLIYLEQAIVTSQVAISLIEELRNSYLSHESKLQIAEQENETFRNALSQCYLAYTATNDPKYARLGFEVSEKSKSAILLSYLRELDARNFGGIPEAYLNEENYLSKRIAYYKENLYEESKEESPDSIKIKNWNNYLFEYIRDHEKLLTNLEERYPQYYKLKYDNEVVNISDFQGGLKRNATLVEYALVDSVLYTYVVSKNRYELLSQKLSPVFFDALHDYLKVYQSFDFSKQSYTGFTEFIWNSKTLYDYLIRPAEKYMTGEEMIIVPDGILSYLPFETLINEVPNEIPRDYYRNLNYLINQYAISYSFSSTLYYQVMKQTGKGSRREVLAFAPEYSGNNYAKTPESMITRQQYRKNLFPIPGVAEEIETLEKILPTDVYLGKEASETNFLRLASQYDLLHLAMHTVIDNHNPMFSKLIFSPGADSLNDGLLNTHEIFGLDLKARMVVLSACSTGEGDISTGEGVMSLARGFVYAGSPSLVMTLWEVEDRSGIVLMKNFYLNLLKGMNKPQALRKAKIDFIREMKPENTHPFFWSSYVVLGNTQPIFHRSRLLYGLSIIFLLFLVSGIFFRKKIFMRRG
jgi:CHAT domain-containing protein